MPEKFDITLNINGRDYPIRVEPRRTLVDAIRDDCGQTGTHIGCEHGICGACTVILDDDAVRAAYLERGLAVVHEAIDRGIDVRGFFHWTAVDNYEWLHGYDVAFGIIDRERNVRPSAAVLRREATGR